MLHRFYPLTLAVYIVLCGFLTCTLINAAQRRTALVIGNADYKEGRLRNPVHDASDISQALKQLGFELITLLDANLREMEDALDQFNKSLRLGGLGLFYYAGHGIQVHGENYLIPLGARLSREQDVRYSALALGRVLAAMEDADNGLNLVILDACRSNPFTRSWRSSQRGLAVVAAADGMIIAYATGPGKVAADGSGRNGTYTQYLLRHMATPGLPVELMLKQVRAGVASATQGEQIPWSESSLIGDVYLATPAQEFQPQIDTPAAPVQSAETSDQSSTSGLKGAVSTHPTLEGRWTSLHICDGLKASSESIITRTGPVYKSVVVRTDCARAPANIVDWQNGRFIGNNRLTAEKAWYSNSDFRAPFVVQLTVSMQPLAMIRW